VTARGGAATSVAGEPRPRARARRNTTVSRRLQGSYLTMTALVLVALQIPLGWLFSRYEIEDLAANAILTANTLSDFVEHLLVTDQQAELQGLANAYRENIAGSIAIFDAEGLLVAEALVGEHSMDLEDHPDVVAALRGERVSAPSSYERGPGWVSVAEPVTSGGEVVGAIDIVMPTDIVERRTRLVWGAQAVFTLAVLAAVAALGGWLTGWATRPLAALKRAAGAWAGGDLTARAGVLEGPSELQDLAASFDTMAGQLGRLIAAQQGYLADASHQLRQPLTVFGLRLASLEPFLAPEAGEKLEQLKGDIIDFARSLDELLLLGQAETQPSPLQSVDVVETVHARQAFWDSFATQRGGRLTVAGGSPTRGAYAWQLPGGLEQILDNLLANALEASPRDSTVSIEVVSARDAIAVHVIDEGPGMSPAERRQAFTSYWRGRTSHEHGAGLGLGIVRRLAAAMDASVELHEATTGGVDAVVMLRRAPSDARPTLLRHPASRTADETC
jgi:signal transduction histidine kinase